MQYYRFYLESRALGKVYIGSSTPNDPEPWTSLVSDRNKASIFTEIEHESWGKDQGYMLEPCGDRIKNALIGVRALEGNQDEGLKQCN